MHQPTNEAGKLVWMIPTLFPGVLVSLALATLGLPGLASAAVGLAVFLAAEYMYTSAAAYSAWAGMVAVAGFPVFGAKVGVCHVLFFRVHVHYRAFGCGLVDGLLSVQQGYFYSTNASLAIGVRRSFGTLGDVSEMWFENQGRWLNYTVAGREREVPQPPPRAT